MEEAKRSEKSRAERLRSNLTFRNQRKSEVVLWIFRVHFVCVCVCVGGGGGEGEEAVQLVYTRKESLTKGETLARDLRKFDG